MKIIIIIKNGKGQSRKFIFLQSIQYKNLYFTWTNNSPESTSKFFLKISFLESRNQTLIMNNEKKKIENEEKNIL